MKQYKYIIKDIPPSNNKYIGKNKRWAYSNDKRLWEWLVREAVGQERPKKPINKAAVILRYHFKDRIRRDPDNYSGKMILDGLVKSKVLKDDSFNNITLLLEGRVDRDNPRTEIIVKEVSHDLDIDWDKLTDVYIDYMQK